MPATFEPAPEVERIGKEIVERFHPHLRGVRIEYVFRSKATKRHGKRVAGTARKITGVNALLATPGAQSSEDLAFFLVTIAKDMWLFADDDRKRALVDHELEHCYVEIDEDGDTNVSIRGHDIEEFASIIGRHGFWSPDLEVFVTSLPAEQLQIAVDLRETAGQSTFDEVPADLA